MYPRDVTVSKSEKIFEYVLKKLTEEKGAILQELLTTVTDRIQSGRSKGICGLVRYLEAPNICEPSLGSSPKKRELAKFTRDAFSRLFPNYPINKSVKMLKILNMISLRSPYEKIQELNDILCLPEG